MNHFSDFHSELDAIVEDCRKYVTRGIMAIVPARMGIGVYSPALDRKGNSVAGRKLLERLSKKLHLSIF